MDETKKKRDDFIYPELSFKIVGILFETYNQLGFGRHEKHYQRAIAKLFKDNNIKFTEQTYFPIKINEEKIGNYYLDFLVENKIVLEIKKDTEFRRKNIEQVYNLLIRKISKQFVI